MISNSVLPIPLIVSVTGTICTVSAAGLVCARPLMAPRVTNMRRDKIHFALMHQLPVQPRPPSGKRDFLGVLDRIGLDQILVLHTPPARCEGHFQGTGLGRG